MNAHRTPGAGWTIDLVKSAVERGAKIEPFNAAFVKIYMKRPEVKPSQFTDYGLPQLIAVSYARGQQRVAAIQLGIARTHGRCQGGPA